MTVQQSWFKENAATYSGGAIDMQKTRGSFLNCTFERNSAKGLPEKKNFGGAICSRDISVEYNSARVLVQREYSNL